MDSWHGRARRRRTAVFAFTLLVHAVLLMLMSNARVMKDQVGDGQAVDAMIVSSPPPRAPDASDAARESSARRIFVLCRVRSRSPARSCRQLAGDGDGMTLIELPHGLTEVHLHGECDRLIPKPRAKSDPFSQPKRLTGPCNG